MQEVPLFPWWAPVFLTIWGVVGPIVGLVVGHYLSLSSQRKQWIADNQRDEYRKLLAALNRLNMTLSSGHVYRAENPEELQRAVEDISIASNTSLFITDFLAESNVLGNILEASRAFTAGGSFENYREQYWKAVNQILESAKKIMG